MMLNFSETRFLKRFMPIAKIPLLVFKSGFARRYKDWTSEQRREVNV
jgi:hypothetical protein